MNSNLKEYKSGLTKIVSEQDLEPFAEYFGEDQDQTQETLSERPDGSQLGKKNQVKQITVDDNMLRYKLKQNYQTLSDRSQ